MQTRSSRRGHNQQFVQQYDRRLEQYRQDAKKRKATDSPSIALQPSRITRAAAAQHSDAVSSSNRARQQQQRGAQGTEENKEGNVIVLDDEEEEEEEEKKEIEEEESSQQQQQQQQKRRRLGSSNQASTSVYATPAVHSRTAASPSTAMSPRPPLRRPLLQSIASTIGRSISNTFELLTSPFSSTATHYTRHKPNTRSTRHTNNPNVSPPSSIAHSSTGRDASLNDDIDRTFRLDDRAFHDSTAYLTYPPHAIRQSVTVTYGDLHRLNPNEFLNDTLIEFYLLYIRDRVVPQRLRGSFHFFNSFLFTRLSEYGSDGVREVYQHVKGWTKGVNLFEKDWIVMPINDADRHHWSLVIIAHPGRAMRPSGMSNIGAALTADRAKQKQQLAGGGARRADSRAILRGGASVQGQKRNNAATPSPTQASLGSSTRLPPRNGKLQQSIPDLFALHNTAPPPSSLFALSAPPLTVPKPAVKPTRSLRPRSHGEELALLIQQQQPNSVKLVTRSSLIDALMSPDNQTTRRLTESKGNIRASMHHSPYSKQQRSDDYLQRKQEDEWRRAIAVPDEQPITSDTQHAEVEEEWTEEEGVQPAAAVSSAGRAAGVLPPQYIADLQFEDVGDDVGDVEEHAVPLNGTEQKASSSREISTSDEVDQGEKPQQQAADAIDDEFDFDDVDADEAGLAAPRLPRIADSVPPTLPLPTQTSLSSSPSATSASDRISEADEAGWRPCILHLDSLPIPPSQTKKIANILREYLQCEWEHQQQLHGIPQPASQLPPPPPSQPCVSHYTVPLQSGRRFDDKSFPHYDVTVPEQPNDYDCGVYILQFAELFCAEPWDDLRRLDKEGWLSSRMQRGGDMRRRMRRLLQALQGDDQFERAKEESRREMEREVEQKRRDGQQQQQQGQKVGLDGHSDARHTGVFVPDSDEEQEEEGGERRRKKGVRNDSDTNRRFDGMRASGGQRVLAGDAIESGGEAQSVAVNRAISFVPSSQPADDEYGLQ